MISNLFNQIKLKLLKEFPICKDGYRQQELVQAEQEANNRKLKQNCIKGKMFKEFFNWLKGNIKSMFLVFFLPPDTIPKSLTQNSFLILLVCDIKEYFPKIFYKLVILYKVLLTFCPFGKDNFENIIEFY